MSIRRKILLLVSVIVALPMIFILFLSYSVLNGQIEKAAQGYLQNASIIARNQMLYRLDEMRNLSAKTAKSQELEIAMQQKDTTALNQVVQDISKVYNYIDFYMIFDSKKQLFLSPPDGKKASFTRLNSLLAKAEKSHDTITSEEQFSLDDLFVPDSKEYNKFKVLIAPKNKDNNSSQYLTKCLAAINISPVYSNKNGRLLGYLVIGAIANNDAHFPKVYSMSVKDSYLAISVDGIRIASNIRSPKTENYIGSSIPIKVSTLEGTREAYYGRDKFDDETHLFLDSPILNCDGNLVGVLGVGIPENKFSIIMHTQRNIVIFGNLFSLVLMLFVGRYAANRITQPIIKATEMANQIAQGNKEIIIEERFLEDKNSETTTLLLSFQRMANDLKNSEEQRAEYLEKLQNEHAEQQKLSEELALLNASLEEKVELRTRDLREAVNSLQKAGEVKSRFLANMSHELRTPLSAIINYSQILKEEIFGTLNDKQHRYIGNVLSSGTHLLQLINDVLDISKIEAGKMTLTIGSYSISNLVEESFLLVKSLAYRKNIEIAVNIYPADFIVTVDANKLKQIICNLLSNAIKFSPQSGKVSVEVIKDKENMYLTVKDNGIGIKEEDQERIFKEFEQVDSSYKREYEGTGLGLPLTKKLVEMHGGQILLESQLGKGTEVIVIMPIRIGDVSEGGFIE